jgi:exopolysaccharide biosynthesis polyprenyl glycosylphosphotransferase
LGAAILIPWRLFLHHIISDERIASHLRQRILLIGWTPEAGRLSQSVWQQRKDPCEIVGFVELSTNISQCSAPPNIPYLGGIDDLPQILEDNDINVAWLSDVNANGARIPFLAGQCEKEMVEFKIIPSYFPILLSALHVENVAGTPILGVDRLPLNLFHLRLLKRLVDIAGAIVGLILTAPIIACFCAIVYAESPGPVFYRQTRMGRKGMPFRIIKIRSMRLDAEKNGRPGWTTKDDPRRLRIGSLMRKWNIDELPQFWNVLKGEMSLVGPRPERPELIQNFKHEIRHYNARHTVKPGVTGWAQVNGLRGDTDLSERIRHDIYYLEHWSPVFDFRIILLTFFRHANAC